MHPFRFASVALAALPASFDLLVVPEGGHGAGGAYGEHKRYDFFVQHLLGLTPPPWKSVEPPKTPSQPAR